ncbi:hypothetical protein [Cereibacter sphaeroides]|uniref:hypothetical protein n=1 Tax=Cereibacter sphaeroides TaxID=1063 RepID=UPI0011C381CD|nr:hypothetical protein [Cereibacter sphaeroides]
MNKNAKCPNCSEDFERCRKDQRYCSDRCRKNASQRRDRIANPRNSRHSPTKRRENELLFDISLRIAEDIYTLPPDQRFDYVSEIVNTARSGNARLRNILTNRVFRYPDPNKKRLFHRSCPASYFTASEVVEVFSRLVWSSGLTEVVYGEAFGPPCISDEVRLTFARSI